MHKMISNGHVSLGHVSLGHVSPGNDPQLSCQPCSHVSPAMSAPPMSSLAMIPNGHVSPGRVSPAYVIPGHDPQWSCQLQPCQPRPCQSQPCQPRQWSPMIMSAPAMSAPPMSSLVMIPNGHISPGHVSPSLMCRCHLGGKPLLRESRWTLACLWGPNGGEPRPGGEPWLVCEPQSRGEPCLGAQKRPKTSKKSTNVWWRRRIK